jgi:hypothetical protein
MFLCSLYMHVCIFVHDVTIDAQVHPTRFRVHFLIAWVFSACTRVGKLCGPSEAMHYHVAPPLCIYMYKKHVHFLDAFSTFILLLTLFLGTEAASWNESGHNRAVSYCVMQGRGSA